jgi:hypothetical protein
MDTSPYAPPKAVVADVAPPASADSGSVAFFPVSRTKLLVLSFCTLGLYQYYWFYKNWKIIGARTGEDFWPVPRALFAIFFCYSLFDRVRKHESGSASALSAGALATAWIVVTLLYKLPDPYWLIAFLNVFILLPVQDQMNAVNDSAAPKHDPNGRFTAWNWVAVAVGGPFFLMAVVATFFPPP